MKVYKFYDFIVNAFMPLLAGSVIYLMSPDKLIRNYLPDGLWAYAVISAILIVWDRQVNKIWIAVSVIAFTGFEIAQVLQLLSGTGDLYDIIVYLLFGSMPMLFNIHFKQLFSYNHEHKI